MKRFSKKVIFIILIVLFVIGHKDYSYAGYLGGYYSYYHSNEKTFSPRALDCDFRIMTTLPGPEYQEIGILSGGTCGSPNCMKERSGVEVCKSGGDLVVVSQNAKDQFSSGTVFRKKTATK